MKGSPGVQKILNPFLTLFGHALKMRTWQVAQVCTRLLVMP